ncbi:MAG: PAS domain S-box protein [Terracidiphilus sp.]|nr:PAS domain S-box protein [Terracidiphilus sp.]MDR3797135.1 PAS domain S-box protein [Terracidiphilus sp.]
MPVATFCFDLKSPPRLVSAGEDVEALLGYSREDFLTASVHLLDRIHPEDASLAETLFSQNSTNTSGSVNLRIRHADGRIRCLKARYAKTHTQADGIKLDLWMEDARKVTEPGDAILIASFTTLIEDTNDYIYIKNRNHVILAASRNLANLIEANGGRTELVGTTDYDNHPEQTADIYYRLEEKAFAEGRRVSEIQQVPAKDGTKRWIDNRKYPINGTGGEIIGVLGIAPDVTERVEAEVRLRESEESLRDAHQIAGLGNYLLDIPNQMWKASPQVDALLGLDASDDHRFEAIWPLIHPDDRSVLADRIKAQLSGEVSTFDREYRIVRKMDGTIRWAHVRGRLERDAQGKPLALRGTVQDITERKLVETALRESEDSLRQAQSIAGLGSYNLDVLSGVWSSSEVMDEIFGIDRAYERTVGGWLDLIHPDDRSAMGAYLADEVLGEGKTFDKVYRIVRHSDGAERWVHGLGKLTRAGDGRPVTMHGTIQDITEAKQVEDALRESEETLREAQRIAGLGIHTQDLTSGASSASDILREILGVGPDYNLSSSKWMDLVHPEDRAAVEARFTREALNKSPRFEMEHRIVRNADNAVRWVRAVGRIEFDSLGGPGKLRGTIQDITDVKLAEAALRESKELLQLFIGHAPAALAMLDREMRYLAVSRRWLKMHAFGDTDVIGRSHYELFSEIPESWREEHRRCLAGEKVESSERALPRADGSVQWIRREILPWRAGDGSVGGIVIFSEDITERKMAEERLRLAATVFTGAREGIVITDPSGTILEVNDAFTRITGFTRDEALGTNPRMLQSGLQRKEFYANMWSALARDGHWSGEIWNRNKYGDIYAEMLTIDAIHDANGQVKQYVGLFTDITEVKEHQQQLELVAHYDALTGLPNRALFADRLRQAMEQAHRRNQLLGVVCFDLDAFKAINDGYGHASGDALLTALAFRMKRALREGDTLARLGGDEFAAVILDLPDRDACLHTLTRMLEAAAKEVQIGDLPLRVTASAGVTFYPQTEEVDADMLLRQAGQALYEAKLAGKNRFCIFDPSHDLMARSRHENIEHIRRALAANELVLFYQPKVNMRTGKVIGAEALLRWQHPERGLLPPGLFLPVIEGHPLAVEVGNWVIESALAQMEAWQESGFEMTVSVNVSAFELQQPDFVSRLCARLAAHPRVKPSHLELEVLETSALQNVALSSQVLTACRAAGVLISVDDFGTGYSSLVYLKRLPADILKIDQSFVRDMLDEPENLTILKGVLGLAEAFRRHVIAEGVETVDHGLMLLQLGCDFAQGYGIAKPMPAKELQAWAAAWRPDPRWVEVPAVHANNRAVLFAIVEHRVWYGHLLAYLQGTRPSLPSLDAGSCSLSAWLDARRISPGGMSPSLVAIETLHNQLHALAAEIYNAHASGRKQDGLALLRQLRYLNERCLKRLQPFTRLSSHKSASDLALRHGAESSGSDAA